MIYTLRSCPFCGHEPRLYGTPLEGWLGCINGDCPVQPSTGRKLAKEGNLVEAWNRRAQPVEVSA